MTIEQKILEAIEQELTTALTDVSVESNRDAEVTEFPTVVVVDGDATINAEATGRDEYQLQVDIEGYVAADTSQALRALRLDLFSKVVKAVMADRTHGNLAEDTRLENRIDLLDRREGARPNGGFALTILVIFWTQQGNPDVIGPAY